jgi:integrase
VPRLRKRGRVWWSDLYIGGRRIRKPLATDRVVAEERLADLIKDREAIRFGHARTDVPWPTFKKKFLDFASGAKAWETYRRDVAALSALEKFHTPRRLAEITPELLEQWKSARRKAGRGPATINRDIRSVKAMMKKAKVWGYIRSWDGTSVKKLPESRGRLLFYTPEEVRRLLEVCRSRMSGYYDWETVALLGCRAGLRRAEMYWLSWADVDLEKNILTVTPKEGWMPKGHSGRHVPIPADLRKRLKSIKRVSPWVLGERPSMPVMSAFFQKISRKAKLKGNLHTLRHTYASHLVQGGVDLYTVSELLGHTDPKMSRIYAHLAPHNLQDAVKRLPKL